MKYYLMTTGFTFGLLFLSHFLRASVEGFWLFGEPIFLFTTFLSMTFCIWSIILLNKAKHNN